MNEYMCILLMTVSNSHFIRRRYLIKEELIRSTGEMIMTGETEVLEQESHTLCTINSIQTKDVHVNWF